MRRILGLLLLSQAVVGFLPPSCPLSSNTNTPTHPSSSNSKKSTCRWVLGGSGGEFDLLKGSKPSGKADPAPGEFDLLGNIAGAEGAAVIKEVCVCVGVCGLGERAFSRRIDWLRRGEIYK